MTGIAKQIADNSLDSVLKERGNRYGEFSGHADITQAIKRTIAEGPSAGKLSDSQREALDMIAHKIGRIVNGDPDYVDSWVDIAGYAQLVVDQLRAIELADREAKAKSICERCNGTGKYYRPCDAEWLACPCSR